MELGMIGLGRMGTNLVRRLLRAGHPCVVYDLDPKAIQVLVNEGAIGTTSLEEFSHKLSPPRAAWMMLSAAVVDPLSAMRYGFGGHAEKTTTPKGGAS